MDTFAIMDIRSTRNRKTRICLDKGPAFSIDNELIVEAGLYRGKVLSPTEIKKLKSADKLRNSFDRALKYIGPRPRSELEIRMRLARYGYDNELIHTVIIKLKRQGFVDDAAFARYWRDNRDNFKPRSRRLIELELKQKGVDTEIISEATVDIDDESAAYKAALKKTRSFPGLDYMSYRRRMGNFLRRRGFDYELINRTIERVWQEQGNVLSN